MLGGFNVRVGKDSSSWPLCLGKYNIGRMNENGQRLLEHCTRNDLCITNSFFQTKERHKVTWKHPRSGHWHQLDFIITRRQHLNQTSLTRSYHSADCDTDHSLVVARVRLRPKRIYTAKHKSIPRINITNTKDPEKCFEFQQQFEDALTATSEMCSASEK